METVKSFLPLHARITAVMNAHTAAITLCDAVNIAGTVIADSVTYGT